MLIHTCHAMPMPCRGLEKSLSEQHGHGMAQAKHGRCESNTATLCTSNGKDTIYTLIATAWAQDGNGMAGERHGMGTAWAQDGNSMICVN
jgi:hypothetical protein